jgi:hypothetical protein
VGGGGVGARAHEAVLLAGGADAAANTVQRVLGNQIKAVHANAWVGLNYHPLQPKYNPNANVLGDGWQDGAGLGNGSGTDKDTMQGTLPWTNQYSAWSVRWRLVFRVVLPCGPGGMVVLSWMYHLSEDVNRNPHCG